MSERLASGLWVEAKLRELDRNGVAYYIVNKGAYFSGTVLLKINSLAGGCRVLNQIRDEDDKLVWMSAFKEEIVEEQVADSYIQRAISRDPDVWVIDIESKSIEEIMALFS